MVSTSMIKLCMNTPVKLVWLVSQVAGAELSNIESGSRLKRAGPAGELLAL